MGFNPIAAFKAFIKTLFAKYLAEGQAAVKLAEHDVKIELAKVRLAAINEANKVKTAVVSELHTAAADAHAVADKITADLEAVLAKL